MILHPLYKYEVNDIILLIVLVIGDYYQFPIVYIEFLVVYGQKQSIKQISTFAYFPTSWKVSLKWWMVVATKWWSFKSYFMMLWKTAQIVMLQLYGLFFVSHIGICWLNSSDIWNRILHETCKIFCNYSKMIFVE